MLMMVTMVGTMVGDRKIYRIVSPQYFHLLPSENWWWIQRLKNCCHVWRWWWTIWLRRSCRYGTFKVELKSGVVSVFWTHLSFCHYLLSHPAVTKVVAWRRHLDPSKIGPAAEKLKAQVEAFKRRKSDGNQLLSNIHQDKIFQSILNI